MLKEQAAQYGSDLIDTMNAVEEILSGQDGDPETVNRLKSLRSQAAENSANPYINATKF